MSKYQFLDRRVPIEDGNIALVQDLSKCKNCSLCRKACAVDMGVFDYYDLTQMGIIQFVFIVVNVHLFAHSILLMNALKLMK